ncbi:Monooxygenase FAD-binding [Penicillium bovifimosum]|uniref:Monooxygenase FAD-binding n=1 Tax=Penicillium bovifimosum TaxID=126998 RepID=A0A9W9GU31_9EURO|nr:Monooxygenase FAD-binding [Penicillium bovifimosum]KAJ5129997.1 Monooxygenase FAD-binding [Penicillium bovifimosum]
MAPQVLKVLICGGGIAGPALAYWLAQLGHKVIVVERFPTVRATGAQVDIRGQGITAIKRMGLHEAIRSKLVDEAGVSIVNSRGKTKATILANKSGKGASSLSSEYEIMRGDLVRILHEATEGEVKYIFGKTVDSFKEHGDQVVAYFSDGSSDTFDMLVGADGQGSRVRRNIQPVAAPSEYHNLGVHMAYCFIPRIESDPIGMCRAYLCPGRRMIMTRTHNEKETQIYFILLSDSEELRAVPKLPIQQQKKAWANMFHDAGWQSERFIKEMQTTDNWFCQDVVQVKTDTWHSGRVVLLGDAAHCPSPLTGMGTTSSLVGAYVLAGEISRSQDLTQAFENYHKIMQPYVDEIQQLNTGWLRWVMAKSQGVIAIIHFLVGLACFLRIPQLIARLSNDWDGDWKLPDYPELDVDQAEKR